MTSKTSFKTDTRPKFISPNRHDSLPSYPYDPAFESYRLFGEHFLAKAYSPLDHPAPKLFLVLPDDPHSGVDTDTRTRVFRLYFICDPENTPGWFHQQKHISDHEGYELKRPTEFFQKFGHYALSILMVFRGKTDLFSDASKLLWSHMAHYREEGLSQDNIKARIEKAIDYLKAELPPLPMNSEIILDPSETRQILHYLDVKDGDNTTGNLYRFPRRMLSTSWVCQSCFLNRFNAQALATPKDFVRCQIDNVDIYHGKIQVLVATVQQAKRSAASYARFICDFARCGVSVLEIDGVTPIMHPQNCIEYTNDLVVSLIKRSAMSYTNGIQVLTLLNYPRPKEQYSYLARTHDYIYGLRHTRPFCMPSIGWNAFRQSLYTFENAVHGKVFTTSKGSLRIALELQALLAESGLKRITTIDFYNRQLWRDTFDVTEGIFLDVQLHPSRDDGFSEAQMHEVFSAFALTSAQSLTMDTRDAVFDLNLNQFIQKNQYFQELILLAWESEVFDLIGKFVQHWYKRASRLDLTLYERSSIGHAKMLIRAVIGSRHRFQSTNTSIDRRSDSPEPLIKFDTLERGFVNATRPLTNEAVMVLEAASFQHPRFLSSFTLDISHLSSMGL
ncbi:hypothetical protein BGZ81_010856 [Podila clonocystis]|nr:hypothetical protein BGZ81_010856 [Podila clonocystis]